METLRPYKLLVAGSRGFTDTARLAKEIMNLADNELRDFSVGIVTGMARGADLMAYQFAKEHNVICHKFPADWARHDRRAGFIRNEEMGVFSDGLLAFWDGESRGTKHMIEYMRKLGKDVRIIYYGAPENGSA